MKRTSGLLGLLMTLCLSAAEAANQEIRALFQPDPSQPNKNVFINKTPDSGYCASYPGQCADNNMFSIQVPIRFNTVTPLFASNGIWVKVPAEWRELTVTNQQTQETSKVQVRISGIGSKFHLSKPVTELTGQSDVLEGHRKLWTSNSWVYATPPCLYSGVGFYSPTTYAFFWKTPQPQACVKTAAFDVGQMYFDNLDIAYELRTPNPLDMSTGLYTGSLNYSVGRANADFTMGPFFDSDDSNLRLDFVLDVQHTLKVDLPPGGNKVALEPEGGWQRWIASGQRPSRIYRDQLFHLSASSRFKVRIECDSIDRITDCRMLGDRAEPNPAVSFVQTKLSLPLGITGPDGAPVQNLTLGINRWSGPFQPGFYIDRKPGNLRFEMPSYAIQDLLRPGINEVLKTDITVIWDSEV
jgi:hypothetical protein